MFLRKDHQFIDATEKLVKNKSLGNLLIYRFRGKNSNWENDKSLRNIREKEQETSKIGIEVNKKITK